MRSWLLIALVIAGATQAQTPRVVEVLGIQLGMSLPEANAALGRLSPDAVLAVGTTMPLSEHMGDCDVTHIARIRPGTHRHDVAVALNAEGRVWCIWRSMSFFPNRPDLRPAWDSVQRDIIERYGRPTRGEYTPVEIELFWMPADPRRAEPCLAAVQQWELARAAAALTNGALPALPPAECSPLLEISVLLVVTSGPLGFRTPAEPQTVDSFTVRYRDPAQAGGLVPRPDPRVPL